MLKAIRISAMLLLLFVTLLPIYWVLVTSVRPDAEVLSRDIRFWPSRFTTEHYRNLFEAKDIRFYLKNSLIAAAGSTVLSVSSASLAAYAFARFKYPGNLGNTIRMWILSTRFIPPFAIVLPLFLLFRDYKLLDTHQGMIIAHTLFSLPFVLWMLQTSFEELPYEIEEAALIDGCSRLKAFFYVVLPLAAPAIAAATIFALLLSWNEFLFALLFAPSRATTLPVLVSQFFTDRSLQWGQIAASATVAIVPIFIFMLFAQRYLVRGLTMGAVKS
jgi:ABC-type glycerol-3-phosphate transport system permease component